MRKCIVLDEDLDAVCSQNVSHSAGNIPAILVRYAWFRVDSDGIRPLCLSSFGHLLVYLDSYVLYHDGRYSSCRYNERQLIDVTVVRIVRPP